MSFHITLKFGFQIEEYSTYPSREERMHRSIKGQNEKGFSWLQLPAPLGDHVLIGGYRRRNWLPSRPGVLIGTIAGALLFGLVIGVGSLVGWRNGRSNERRINLRARPSGERREGKMPIQYKCPKCGLPATWTLTGATNGTISSEEPYARCPTITDRLDRGEQRNVAELSCPDFYAATVQAVTECRRSAL